MRIPRFYQDTQVTSGEQLTLDQRASKHLVQVLRMQHGHALIIFDGKGHSWEAVLNTADTKAAIVDIQHPLPGDTESPLSTHLGLGISKGERMDYAIQKAVELGVSAITPLFTQYTMVKLDKQRQHKRLQHWQGVIISACEQCGRNNLPQLHEPIAFHPWLDQERGHIGLVLDPRAKNTLTDVVNVTSKLTLLIGPEGGLSDDEVDAAKAKGFHGIQLGPRILRTETAVVASLAAIQTCWGDLR